MYSYGPPHMAKQKQDDQPELTYSSYVRTQDVTQKTCRGWWMIGRSGERWSGISVLAARHDDDVVIREWWFLVHFIHAEDVLLSIKSNWRRFEATFKLRPVIPIFERNEMTECPRKLRQPTSIGITWLIQPFSMQSAHSVSYRFFFRSCASSRFSSQGTINSMRRTHWFNLLDLFINMPLISMLYEV